MLNWMSGKSQLGERRWEDEAAFTSVFFCSLLIRCNNNTSAFKYHIYCYLNAYILLIVEEDTKWNIFDGISISEEVKKYQIIQFQYYKYLFYLLIKHLSMENMKTQSRHLQWIIQTHTCSHTYLTLTTESVITTLITKAMPCFTFTHLEIRHTFNVSSLCWLLLSSIMAS